MENETTHKAGAANANVDKPTPQGFERPMAPDATANTTPAPPDGQPKPSMKKERPPSKIATVIALLEREQGATLAEMVEATGWLPHTTRAALTGLKKKAHTIARAKRDDVTCYRIAKAAK